MLTQMQIALHGILLHIIVDCSLKIKPKHVANNITALFWVITQRVIANS